MLVSFLLLSMFVMPWTRKVIYLFFIFFSFRNSTYRSNVSKCDDSDYDRYMYDTKYSWNNDINSCIDGYLWAQIYIDSYFLSGSHNDSYICGK